MASISIADKPATSMIERGSPLSRMVGVSAPYASPAMRSNPKTEEHQQNLFTTSSPDPLACRPCPRKKKSGERSSPALVLVMSPQSRQLDCLQIVIAAFRADEHERVVLV